VLPVGGIKEKVLAARRSGIRTVVLPETCRKNLEEIPRALRRELEFVFVGDVQAVFRAAFVGKETTPNDSPRRSSSGRQPDLRAPA